MTGHDGQDGARETAGDAYTGGAAEATAPVYTIRSLRANLREALATVRETGVPAIIAERGERPVAVLVDYASWAAQQGDGGRCEMRAWAEPPAGSERTSGHPEPDPLVGPAQAAQSAAPPLPAGWGGASTPARTAAGEPAAIPPGWRAATGGWGL